MAQIDFVKVCQPLQSGRPLCNAGIRQIQKAQRRHLAYIRRKAQLVVVEAKLLQRRATGKLLHALRGQHDAVIRQVECRQPGHAADRWRQNSQIIL